MMLSGPWPVLVVFVVRLLENDMVMATVLCAVD